MGHAVRRSAPRSPSQHSARRHSLFPVALCAQPSTLCPMPESCANALRGRCVPRGLRCLRRSCPVPDACANPPDGWKTAQPQRTTRSSPGSQPGQPARAPSAGRSRSICCAGSRADAAAPGATPAEPPARSMPARPAPASSQAARRQLPAPGAEATAARTTAPARTLPRRCRWEAAASANLSVPPLRRDQARSASASFICNFSSASSRSCCRATESAYRVAEKCAPASSNSPERNAQIISPTET